MNHNPRMKIAPSELCLWEGKEKKKTTRDPQQSSRLYAYELSPVEHNKKTELYAGESNVSMQNALTA